jgi:hypothetical protein
MIDEYVNVGTEYKYESDGITWMGMVYEHSITGDRVIWWMKGPTLQ